MNSGKIRLAKFLNVFAIGGTERQFVNIAKRLDPARFDLHIACFKRWGAFLPEIEASGWPLEDYPIQGLINPKTVRAQLRFARYLRQHRIEILHTYGWTANLFGIPAARLAGVPVTIASIRDTGVYLSRSKLHAQRVVCRMATCVLANSNAVREWLISEGYNRDKIQVIHNGIVQPDLSALPLSNIRREFSIPVDAPLVGTICRLSPVKAVDDFLRAAATVSQRHPAAYFLVIGDGEERAALQQCAEEQGIGDRVVFTGFRTDTAQVLKELNVSVLASLTEGLSNTLLESMACGVPVVATRVGGNAEIVEDRKTGLLVPARNHHILSEAICQLLSNPPLALQMGYAGKERVQRQFSVDSAVRKTQELYTHLLSRRALAA
jgi:glycosyltransferase involved in cell wall biosynthesis